MIKILAQNLQSIKFTKKLVLSFHVHDAKVNYTRPNITVRQRFSTHK